MTLRTLRHLLSAVSLSAAALFSTSAASAQLQTQVIPSRVVAKVDPAVRTTLSGTIHPLASAANDRGLVPDATPLPRVHLTFKRSDAQQAALTQLVSDLHNSASPSYHQWLTPDQFGKQFGPSDADVAAVSTWLQSQGFAIKQVNPGRQSLEFSGTAGQFRQAFHADIHQYQVHGQTHFANAQNPQIPTALTPVVSGFASLNNFPLKSYARNLGTAAYQPATGKVTPSWTTSSNSTYPNFVLSPADYAVQYDLNPLYTAGTTGAGQTIAIINEANINVYLVNQFRSLFSLPVNPPQIILDGEDPGIDGVNNIDGQNGASVEAYLDVEWAGAVAPNATVDLVIAADTATQSGLILAAEHAVYGNVAPVLSLSFGACEQAIGSENQFLSNLWQQAAAQGQTVLVSTGDSGSAGCDNDNTQAYATQGQAVSGFASTPYNVAVGGTDFFYSQYNAGTAAVTTQLSTYWNQTPSNSAPKTSILGVIPEQPWNDSQYGLNLYNTFASTGSTTIAGGSGGASTCGLPTAFNTTTGAATVCAPYPKPTWQVGTGVPADKVRDIPDVSLFASNGQNASFYPLCAVDGDCQPSSTANPTVQISGVGGTSASTPSFAGIMALINQKYGRQGQANFTLYPLAAQFPAAFHDVTNGTNSVPCQTGTTSCIAVASPVVLNGITEGEIGTGTTPEYNATPGYDLATGLGTVDANVLVSNWNKVVFTGSTTTLTPSSTSFAHGTSVTIAGTVKASGTTVPTGSVSLATDNPEPLQAAQQLFNVTNGAFTGTTATLPGGTYNIYGIYSGDGVNAPSTSAKTSITVTPETPGIDFNALDLDQSGGTILPNNAKNLSYGESIALSAFVGPTASVTAYGNCQLQGGTCPVFTLPTGPVNFVDGATSINTGTFNSTGEAEFAYVPVVGTHTVSASYGGDKSYNAVASAPLTFSIVKDTPKLAGLGASNQTASTTAFQVTGGQQSVLQVYFENSVGINALALSPTGTVTVTGAPAGTTTSTTLTPTNIGVASGVATVVLPATTAPGTYNVTFSYAGDTNYNGVSGTASIQVLAPTSGLAATTTTATVSANATSPAAGIKLTATVTGTVGGPALTGTLGIFSGAFELTSITLPGTSSTYTTPITLNSASLTQGTNVVTVQYSGSASYQASNANVTVTSPLTDFSLNPVQSVVNTPSSGFAVDTLNLGSINGFSGVVALTCTSPAGVTCTLSQASTSVPAGGFAAASVNLTASGAGTYTVSITGADSTGHFVHTVNLQLVAPAITATSGFVLSEAVPVTIATPGSTGTGTILVTPYRGFTGSVALTCALTTSPANAVSLPTCSITNPVTVSGAGAASATLTINSTAQSRLDFAPFGFFRAAGGVTLAALFFFLMPARRRRFATLAAFLACALLLGFTSGCGSTSGGSTTPTPTPGTGVGSTTLGAYVFTVTGTSGSITVTTPVVIAVN